MAVVVIEGPEAELLELSQAKDHLRITYGAEDEYIDALITAARQHVERWCDIAIGAQTWRARFDSFASPLRLIGAPVDEVTALSYIDVEGAEQTISSSDYLLDTDSNPSRLVPASGAWPNAAQRINAVSVTYTLGYTAETLPAPIKAAMLLLIGDLFEHREAQGDPLQENKAVCALLAPYRRVVL